MQTYDPNKPGYINPEHLDFLSTDARAAVVTVDPDHIEPAPADTDVVLPAGDINSAPVDFASLSLADQVAHLFRLVSAQDEAIRQLAANQAMSQDVAVGGGLVDDEAAHVRHVLAKYFSGPNDKPAPEAGTFD